MSAMGLIISTLGLVIVYLRYLGGADTTQCLVLIFALGVVFAFLRYFGMVNTMLCFGLFSFSLLLLVIDVYFGGADWSRDARDHRNVNYKINDKFRGELKALLTILGYDHAQVHSYFQSHLDVGDAKMTASLSFSLANTVLAMTLYIIGKYFENWHICDIWLDAFFVASLTILVIAVIIKGWSATRFENAFEKSAKITCDQETKCQHTNFCNNHCFVEFARLRNKREKMLHTTINMDRLSISAISLYACLVVAVHFDGPLPIPHDWTSDWKTCSSPPPKIWLPQLYPPIFAWPGVPNLGAN